MIVLDTHIWVWWVHDETKLTETQAEAIAENESDIIESTRLPGAFHRDPADQIIVATARLYDCPIVTSDGRIVKYPHVKSIS